MTTTATNAYNVAVASGVNPVPFTFQATTAAEVGVVRAGIELVNGTDYTVSLNGDGTGSVTPTASWGTDDIIVYSNPNYEQQSDFTRFGPYFPDQLVPPLDRLARTILALKSRVAVLPMAIASNLVAQVGRFLSIDSLGQPYFADPPTTPGAPGANVMAIGLFAALSTISVPAGTTIIQTSGHTTAGVGDAVYIEDTGLNDAAVALFPLVRGKSSNGRYFRLRHEYGVYAEQAGIVPSAPAPAAGTNTGPAVAALFAYFRDVIHSNYGNYYSGSPICQFGAARYHMGTTTFEPWTTGYYLGCGSGQDGPGGYGSTLLTFDTGATAGIRLPFPNTSGNTTTGAATHPAPAHPTVRGFAVMGPYVYGVGMAESEAHGLVQRGIGTLEDIWSFNWPGDGWHGWAGTVFSAGSSVVGGNTSTSTINRVRCEYNRWGFNNAGTDSNVNKFQSCTSYLNRQGGVFDDNGAGCNKYESHHCAGNGLATDGKPPTRVHLSGRIFAVRYLRDVQCSTNSPPASATDDANWYFIRTGTADVTQPTWVSGTTYRFGGDYVTTDSAGVTLDTDYVEGDGFSQFGAATLVLGGGFGNSAYRGGRHIRPENDGVAVRNNTYAGSMTLHVDGASGTYASIDGRLFNPATAANDVLGSLYWGVGYAQLDGAAGSLFFGTRSVGVVTNRFYLRYDGARALDSFGYDGSLRATATAQATNKSTAMTLNKVTGSLPTNAAALAAGAVVSFTLNNSFIEADDDVRMWVKSGNATAGTYRTWSEGNGAGSRIICLQNISGGSLSEAIVLGMLVFKG